MLHQASYNEALPVFSITRDVGKNWHFESYCTNKCQSQFFKSTLTMTPYSKYYSLPFLVCHPQVFMLPVIVQHISGLSPPKLCVLQVLLYCPIRIFSGKKDISWVFGFFLPLAYKQEGIHVFIKLTGLDNHFSLKRGITDKTIKQES